MFEAFLLLAAISCVRADFWIVQDYSHAPDGETYNPPSVAIGPDDFTCSAYISGIGRWPTVSYTGLGPWWETSNVEPGLCGNTTGIDMYLDWDDNAAEPFWDVYEHGGDGKNLGSCWIRGDGELTCGDQAKCTYSGGAATGVCHIATTQWYCYSALCG